jgi:hypothetical protein
MSTAPTGPPRVPIRLARAIWIAVAIVAVLVVVGALRTRVQLYTQEQTILRRYRPDLELSGLSSHTLDERKAELEALIDDVERGVTLTKKDVASRLGKPDETQGTGHKQFADRCISTTYRYRLAPGDYLFPNSERAQIDRTWRADFYFDERVKHGRRGRLYYVVDDTTPLVRVSIADNSGPSRFVFPSSKRSRYELPGEKKE